MLELTFRRGVNLTGWFTRRAGREATLLETGATREDFDRLRDFGADHVRLLVDFECIESGSTQKFNAAGMEALDRAIQWSRRANLVLVLVLRGAPGMEYDRPVESGIWSEVEMQRRFASIWRRLAARCRTPDCDHVAFDLLDRPTAPSADDWFGLARIGLAAVRSIDTDRLVFVGAPEHAPGLFCGTAHLNDPRTAYAFSFFHPWIFTHQRAPGRQSYRMLDLEIEYPAQMPDLSEEAAKVPEECRRREVMQYSEEKLDRELLETALMPARIYRRQCHTPVYCAAFGVGCAAPAASRLRWLRDATDLLRAHGMSWAFWEYRGDFGLVDAAGIPDRRVKEILFG